MDKYYALLLSLPSLLAVLGGVALGAYLTYRFGIKAQIQISNYQKQQKAYSQLMGLKFLITQFYVSRFEALIFYDYHEALWKLENYQKQSLQFQEAQRWMHRSEALVFDIAKNNQTLFETIGSIRIVFNDTPELEALTQRIYRFKTPKIGDPPTSADVPTLNSWKEKAVEELQRLVEHEYAEPIDNLLDYLTKEMTPQKS